MFTTIQKGYETQFLIRGKHLPMNKMIETLSPYFTENFLQVFTDENSRSDKQSGEYLLPAKKHHSLLIQKRKCHMMKNIKFYMFMSGRKVGNIKL